MTGAAFTAAPVACESIGRDTEQEGTMQYDIKGGTTPILEITLAEGAEVIAESGELAWMRGPVLLATSTSMGQQKGGFLGAAKRAISGGTFFMTSYTGPGSVVFAAKAPGEIRPVQISA